MTEMNAKTNPTEEPILRLLSEQALPEISNAIGAMVQHASSGDWYKFDESCERAVGTCRKINKSVEQLQECCIRTVLTRDAGSC